LRSPVCLSFQLSDVAIRRFAISAEIADQDDLVDASRHD
jgi:hypothetical protein